MPNPFRNVIYVRIRRGWVGIRFYGWNGRRTEWQGGTAAVLAQNRKGEWLAMDEGSPEALIGDVKERFSAFSHPRVLVCHFEKTVATLRLIAERVGQRPSSLRPIVLVQVIEPLEGGLTGVERRALQEAAARGFRAAKVYEVAGMRGLSDPEVLMAVRRKGRTNPVLTVGDPFDSETKPVMGYPD
jgi:hypothetical protein